MNMDETAGAAYEVQSQQVQTLRVPIQPSKLKPNVWVVSKPVKIVWEKRRPCLIRASLETGNASIPLGDELQPLGEARSSGLFDKYHAKVAPTNSSTGLYGSDDYQCGPLRFRWSRYMLMMEPNFEMAPNTTEAKHLCIIFQG